MCIEISYVEEPHQWYNGLHAVVRGLEPWSGQTKDYEIGKIKEEHGQQYFFINLKTKTNKQTCKIFFYCFNTMLVSKVQHLYKYFCI